MTYIIVSASRDFALDLGSFEGTDVYNRLFNLNADIYDLVCDHIIDVKEDLFGYDYPVLDTLEDIKAQMEA